MARHSPEPSLWASKWMCFPTCLSSISACLRENAKATTQFGKHALSLNALLLCMLFRPLRLIANVSVCVPAHLSNALLPFCFATPIAECLGAEQIQTIPDECHCLLILNPCDLLSCAASLFRPISLNVIVLPCFPILVCWCQISRCLRNARFKNTYSFQMGQRLCLSPFYYILYWPGNLFSHSEIKCANYLQPLSLHVHVFLHSTHLRVYVDIYIYIHIHTYMYTHTSMSNILKAFNLSTILNMF